MANSLTKDGKMLAGSITVDAAGTAQRLVSVGAEGGDFYSRIFIRAKAANTGLVYIGGPDVDSSTNAGLGATAGTGDELDISSASPLGFNISEIYIDADNNDEGVDFWAFK